MTTRTMTLRTRSTNTVPLRSSMTSTMGAVSMFAVVAMTAACPPPEDTAIFDDDIGVQAVSTDDGALAGTFALFTRAVGPIDTVIGEQPSGNDDWMLIERRYDAVNDTYAQSSTLCGGIFLPVLEVQTVVPDPTWRLVPVSEETVVVDHALGTYTMGTHLQLWGLRDLEDPRESPWPVSRDDVNAPAFMDHVFDMDDDENPGVTILASGIVEGEIYAAQRKTSTLAGVVVSADRVIGRSEHLFEVVSLGATVPLLDQGPPQRNPTDVQQSWFEEMRLPADSTCDDVKALVDDGTLGDRPF